MKTKILTLSIIMIINILLLIGSFGNDLSFGFFCKIGVIIFSFIGSIFIGNYIYKMIEEGKQELKNK
jgi:hypothetical protein